jgi:inorganic pyrophosphatase
MANDRFWHGLDTLIASHRVVIDRPRGSAHPRYPDVIYPLDYGYLEGTRAADGSGTDAWLGSLSDMRVTGVVLTVDLTAGDSEIKILLGCTRQEATHVLRFHNQGNQHAMLVRRSQVGEL